VNTVIFKFEPFWLHQFSVIFKKLTDFFNPDTEPKKNPEFGGPQRKTAVKDTVKCARQVSSKLVFAKSTRVDTFAVVQKV
jgi:hypothetical protein